MAPHALAKPDRFLGTAGGGGVGDAAAASAAAVAAAALSGDAREADRRTLKLVDAKFKRWHQVQIYYPLCWPGSAHFHVALVLVLLTPCGPHGLLSSPACLLWV